MAYFQNSVEVEKYVLGHTDELGPGACRSEDPPIGSADAIASDAALEFKTAAFLSSEMPIRALYSWELLPSKTTALAATNLVCTRAPSQISNAAAITAIAHIHHRFILCLPAHRPSTTRMIWRQVGDVICKMGREGMPCQRSADILFFCSVGRPRRGAADLLSNCLLRSGENHHLQKMKPSHPHPYSCSRDP